VTDLANHIKDTLVAMNRVVAEQVNGPRAMNTVAGSTLDSPETKASIAREQIYVLSGEMASLNRRLSRRGYIQWQRDRWRQEIVAIRQEIHRFREWGGLL